MRKSFVVVSLCLITALSAINARAQSAKVTNQTWDVLRQLSAGQKLRVERKDGKKFSGRLIASSDTELQIERKKRTESFNRDDVQKVWQVGKPSRAKQVIFAAIGGGAGFLAGYAIGIGLAFKDCGGNCLDEGVGIIAAIVGLPMAGAAAGWALAGGGKRTLIYSAP